MADSVELRAKVEKLERLKAQANALKDRYPGAIPDEADLQLTVLVREAKMVAAEIQSDRQREARDADLASVDDFLNRPEHKIPHGLNGDADDHMALRKSGWEVKAGIWHAPTSLGVLQPMFPEDVLTGEIPTQDDAKASYYKTTRAAMAPEYKAAYSNFLVQTARSGDPAIALQRLSLNEQKALAEGSDTAGGFLVPPDVQAEVLARTAQMAVMRKHARVITTNRDKVRFPAVAPNTTQGSIYSSGFVGSWAGETPAFADTDPTFQMEDIYVKKLRVATKLSNDFISDAAVNVLSWLSQNGAENMALTEDYGFLLGNNSALQPQGLLNAGIATKDVEGHTTNKLDNLTTDMGSAPKIVDLFYAVPSQYRARASWLMCNAIAGKVYKLVDANGRFYWPELAGSGYAGQPAGLMGHPIDYSDFLPDDGADGNQVLVFGDLSQYIIVQRAQITTLVLRERFADTDQVGIIMFERVGGAIWNLDSVRIGVV